MKPRNILIIEDQVDTLEWLKATVDKVFDDVSIASAETLSDARQRIGVGDFDLLLLDLGLPDGTGLDLIREIRTGGSKTDSPCIVVTTIFDDDRNLITALKLGANGYLLKDDPEQEVIANLRSLTTDRPAFSARALERMMKNFQSPDEEDISLTPREEEVLSLIAKGYNAGEVAKLLDLTMNTVKGYLKTVYAKLGISSRAEATQEAIRRKLVQP